MINLNRAMILGNVTRDIEMRYTPGGQPVSSFTVATNRRWTDSSGNQQEEVEFHDVVAWGKLAEIASQVLGKGQKVYVEGRLKTRNWEGQDGVKRYKTEIIADNLIALDRPTSQEGPGEKAPNPVEDFPIEEPKEKKEKSKKSASPTDNSEEIKKADEAKPANEGDINLEDIPF
jgi:single-strand DNA-binding protein